MFNKTNLSYCKGGTFLQEMKHAVLSAQECAQQCVVDYNKLGLDDLIRGLRYGCDSKCAW